MHRTVCEGHPHILRLRTVDVVAENPATATEALAVLSFATVPALAASRDARDQNLLSWPDCPYPAAYLDDRCDRLVPEDAAAAHLRYVTGQNMQVSAADCGRVHLHDRICIVCNLRVRHLFNCLMARPVVDHCTHVTRLSSACEGARLCAGCACQ